MTTRWRQFIKGLHPEGIPWPGSFVYNALSRSEIFRKHYELVAQDVTKYGIADRILDVGTGPGQLLIALRQTLPNATLIGVDISPAMVVQAQKNIRVCGHESHIELKVAGANALPFADETFDCVVSTGSLHHWKNPICALSEAYRILKVNGYALMYDLVREMPKVICEKVRAQFGSYRLALLWLHSFEEPFLSPEEMEALGRQSDFVVEGTRFAGALCCLVLRKTAASDA
ncbi:MAG: class I SAM-dependent methyltransferase [Nitrospina sp.]|jgi:ubiquinone/menaquinone biosynthesis C-methylase UbiE|nr:class I SAM-dependent methyltransferase [Nitrospina sp.]